MECFKVWPGKQHDSGAVIISSSVRLVRGRCLTLWWSQHSALPLSVFLPLTDFFSCWFDDDYDDDYVSSLGRFQHFVSLFVLTWLLDQLI